MLNSLSVDHRRVLANEYKTRNLVKTLLQGSTGQYLKKKQLLR